MRDWQVISRTVKNARIAGVRSSQYHEGGDSGPKKELFLLVGRMRLWLPGWWVSWLRCCASRTCWRFALWGCWGSCTQKSASAVLGKLLVAACWRSHPHWKADTGAPIGCRNWESEAHETLEKSLSSQWPPGALYWQSLTSCQLAKEKYLQGPAPFL